MIEHAANHEPHLRYGKDREPLPPQVPAVPVPSPVKVEPPLPADAAAMAEKIYCLGQDVDMWMFNFDHMDLEGARVLEGEPVPEDGLAPEGDPAIAEMFGGAEYIDATYMWEDDWRKWLSQGKNKAGRKTRGPAPKPPAVPGLPS